MDDFKKYLESKDIVPRNIIMMTNLLITWLGWLPIKVKDSNYKHLMNYIGHLQKQEKSIHHINRSLQTISHYYQFLELPNVAGTTRVKGSTIQANIKPLTAKQMDAIYESFEVKSKNYFKDSDKIIVGLMIYQGLEMGDFMVLELKDLDLGKGTIYIPGRGQKRSRKVKLQSHQILPLHSYVLLHRDKSSEKLFAPQCDDYHQLHWQFKKLSKHLKTEAKSKLSIEIKKLSHLRQSRIAIWVRSEGIRKAQYLAGFRRVLSAERYRKADLTDLKEQIKKHHPFK